ncbi:inactive protein kinase SELMODRAFT_444075-like [Euphorbia lathyris]|uniref:inactive protein kinase SELMODRAFT_444075-like n=1 Tax=Euphorbia lathyris TaxID=212925 RepID=UPI003313F16B
MVDSEVIIVAVDASKEITDYAFEWAVKDVIKVMDSVIVLAVLPLKNGGSLNSADRNNSNQFLSGLLGKCCKGNNQKEKNSSEDDSFNNRTQPVSLRQINSVCMQMMKQLCLTHKKQVQIQVKILGDAQLGSVALEARELEANWVILDRRLKKEADCCLKRLSCNVVIIDHAVPKLLRAVNPIAGKTFSLSIDQSDRKFADMLGMQPSIATTYRSETNTGSLGLESTISEVDRSVSWSSSETEQFNRIGSPSSTSFLPLNSQYFSPPHFGKSETKATDFAVANFPRSPGDDKIKRTGGVSRTRTYVEKVRKATLSADSLHLSSSSETENKPSNRKYTTTNTEEEYPQFPSSPNLERTSSLRKAMSISIKNPPTPPPLCSICKHNAPIFGKAPIKFSYDEIETATNRFSSDNLLADGGYGFVYKGKLADGQLIAVKQRKTVSAQAAAEFCSEVEILSCAQHRNLVMLIGYCIETEWLLIYEFACNGSLDKHLYGTETNQVMAWHNRRKVAIGAARGLRYLHEDCRVGCIVHRDFRPNNILLTHDYEPMVGDFGLARWQVDGQSAEETRVIGAFGYLAPEYTGTGLITEKADVYAFGVVLLELLSGLKATEFSRITGQQFVQEWASPLLEMKLINEIIDPRLKIYEETEVKYMMYAASLCISSNPETRPRMSKVLKILEGDISADLVFNYGPNPYGRDNQKTQAKEGKNLSPTRKIGVNSRFKASEYRGRRVQEQYLPEISVGGEYQTYLRGSLAKFVQNLNRD